MRCQTCGEEVVTCEECGGKICTPGCPDRAGDGCMCEEAAMEDIEEDF
ncbi:MAG: hypothetical protein WCX29_01370 [Candidatus Peribacteraceae bacterium]